MAERIIIRTIEDLQSAPRLQNGRYNLARADLEGAILTGANLHGAILRRANLTNANLAGADLTNTDLTDAILRNTIFYDENQFANLNGARGGPNVLIITRRIRLEQERRREQTRIQEQERRELQGTQRATLPPIPLKPWVADEECDGKEDPISIDIIPEGRGFKLDNDKENNLEYCYDVVTLARIMNKNPTNPKSPYTTVPFSPNDITRIKDYMKRYPIGGKKTYKNRKINKTKKSRKLNKKRKTIRRIK